MKKLIFIIVIFGTFLEFEAQTVIDTRVSNEPPTSYNSEVKYEFKERGAVGVPGTGYYSGLMTIAPWYDNSGGMHHQFNFNDGGVFYRTGLPDNSSWNTWSRLLMTDSNDNLTLNGNVGIGTTTPSEKLHVNGLIRISSATNEDNNSPGIVSASDEDFLYDNQYINHYAFGFHGFQDGSTAYTEPENTYMSGYFGVDFFTSGENRMRISRDGIVSIGTVNRQVGYKLAVNGNIKAKEIKVETGWSDFVFESNYNLPTLKEVEQHIKEKGHLKDIPSAEDVKENGIFLGEMDSKLLQKIEELTLYAIQQQKEIESQNSKIEKLEKSLTEIEKLLVTKKH